MHFQWAPGINKIIQDARMRPFLMVDLQNARVLLIAGGEDPGGGARKKNARVSAVTVNEAADHKHGEAGLDED